MTFLPEPHSDLAFVLPWGMVVLLGGMLLAEFSLIRWVHDPAKRFPWRPWLLSHLPWAFLLMAPWFLQVPFPAPHDDPARKLEVLFGCAFVGHLFLFVGAWLWGSRKAKVRASTLVGGAALFFFSLTTLWTARVCDLSGDEPHYLLMAQSLLKDGDLDLINNYANRDYEAFYHRGTLEPQGLEHLVEGRRYSHHPLGTVLVVLPGFAALGRMGASLTMALLAALALFLTLRAMEESGPKGWSLLAVGAVGLLSSPLLLFSGLIFPEVPTACLVALSALLFLRKRWILMGLCLGAMIWMHNRNILLTLPLFGVAAISIWKAREGWVRNLVKLYAGLKVPAFLLMGYFYLTYGVLTPLGAHNEPFTSLFRLGHFWDGFFGLILDQECGLLFHFPVFAMSVMGAVLMLRERHPLGPLAVWVGAFYYLFMAFYENLGLTPATRYMVGLTPLLLMMMVPALEGMKKWDFWAWSTLLAAGGGALMGWVLTAVPWMRYNQLQGENWVLKIAGDFLGFSLCAAQPAFNVPTVEWKSYIIGVLWVSVTVVLTVLFGREKGPQPAKRRRR